ncbi:sugar 3,4-ketoisomerase [Arcticibacter eurypsychrophilus]|uniref:sugar 3,4-ketoisomerase n=1 Tax=Arcticibacter eurypsychrophilus TaxID=1434752 RepID=UPI00084D2964|nr:FdtA/QdtA family cupin domain-containing protein [Arcticibacter eurypsychrophilus]
MSIDLVKIIKLPKSLDERGNLSFLEEERHIPFKIKRSYWIYDVPGGEARGGHSYHKNEEIIIALSGSFDVILDDGNNKKTYSLNRSYYALFVPKGIWRYMENFSTNSLCFIVASTVFDEEDYQRDYQQFINSKINKS